MNDKVLNAILNVFKVKSIVTFATVGMFVYLVINNQIETATSTAIIMLVFNNLFEKNKKNKESEE